MDFATLYPCALLVLLLLVLGVWWVRSRLRRRRGRMVRLYGERQGRRTRW